MSIKGDFAALNAAIRFLDKLPDTIRGDATKAAAQSIEGVARGQYAAGQGPDGQAWPRNKDGSISLQGPTKEITFSGSNGTIKITAPDVLQYHQEKRPTLPQGNTLPAPWATAATKAIEKTLEDAAPKKR